MANTRIKDLSLLTTPLDTDSIAVDGATGTKRVLMTAVRRGADLIRDTVTTVYVADPALTFTGTRGGSDITGDGSFAAPYATVPRALRECSFVVSGTGVQTVTPALRVRILVTPTQGYTAPGFSWFVPADCVNGEDFGTNSPLIIESYPADASLLNTLTDPRFTLVQTLPAPLTATQVNGCQTRYTFADGTIPDDRSILGRQVRAYVAGVESSRGIVFWQSNADPTDGADTITVSWRGSVGRVGTTSDTLYVTTPAVKFTSALRLYSSNTVLLRNILCQLSSTTGTTNVNAAGCFIGDFTGAVPAVQTSSAFPLSRMSFGSAGDTVSDPLCAPTAVWRQPGVTTGSVLLSGALSATFSAGACVYGAVTMVGPMSQVLLGLNTAIYGALSANAGARINLQGSVAAPTAQHVPAGSGYVAGIVITDSTLMCQVANSVHHFDSRTQVITGVVLATNGKTETGKLQINLRQAGDPTTTAPVYATQRDSSIAVVAGTLVGATGNDVKTGGNAAITFATLAGLANQRDNDASQLCSTRSLL